MHAIPNHDLHAYAQAKSNLGKIYSSHHAMLFFEMQSEHTHEWFTTFFSIRIGWISMRL